MNKKYNTDIPGWMSEKELKILSTLAGFVPEGGSILEVGCFLGLSTTALYRGKHSTVTLDVVDNFSYGPLNAPIEKIGFAPCNVDIWYAAKEVYKNNGWKEAFKFCIGEEMYANINLHTTDSKDFAKDKNYNLTFIDGSHDYVNVFNDINKFMSDDDLILGDDFHPAFPGITLAINRTRQQRTVIIFENTKLWALIPLQGYWKDVFKSNNLLFLD